MAFSRGQLEVHRGRLPVSVIIGTVCRQNNAKSPALEDIFILTSFQISFTRDEGSIVVRHNFVQLLETVTHIDFPSMIDMRLP